MEKEKYYGIYINGKIPKESNKNNELNYYHSKIKLKFKGKAYIVKENNKLEELKNNSTYKISGKHTIKFINKNKEVYFINISIKKYYFLIFFFIAFLILLYALLSGSQNFISNSKIYDDLYYDIDFNNDNNIVDNRYVFNISFENTDFKTLSLNKNVKDDKYIYPGSEGYFYIQISTERGNKDMFYFMQVENEYEKPNNLKFEIDGKVFNSMKELSESVNGDIKENTNKMLTIRWFWDYESEDGDFFDTSDGENLENYKVLMRIIGKAKEG